MSRFFLDSADINQVTEASTSGIVTGVTTNPAILHQAAPTDPVGHVISLLELFKSGPIFFQLHSRDRDSAMTLVHDVLERAGSNSDRLVFKLPAQPWLYSLGLQLTSSGHRVAFTAVYNAGQAAAAVEAGASYVIPYVDRARRLRPDDVNLLQNLRAVAGEDLCILAASIKSAEQGLSALTSGAHAITAQWPVLRDLMIDELTDTAVEQFHDDVPAMVTRSVDKVEQR